MIKAAIFDLDGVMADSDKISSNAYEAIIKEYNKIPQYFENGLVSISGVRQMDMWKILKEKHEIEEKIEVLAEKRNKLYITLLNALLPQPGLMTLLDLLKTRNVPLAVASSGLLPLVKKKLEILGVIDFFDKIISGDQVEHGKPAPDIFLKAARQLAVSPKECIVFEDAEVGVIAAHAAGMKVIAIPTEYTKKHDFSKANIVVNSLDEVTWKMLTSL